MPYRYPSNSEILRFHLYPLSFCLYSPFKLINIRPCLKVDGPAPLPTPGIQEEEAGPADMESRLSRARGVFLNN